MIRKIRRHWFRRWLASITAAAMAATILPCGAQAQAMKRTPPVDVQLPSGHYQALDRAGLSEFALGPAEALEPGATPTHPRRAARPGAKPEPDVRPLTAREMRSLRGRGNRNAALCGVLPWQRSFRDVNVCNGNLFKSFTDIQVAPAKGAGLVLQRTYNSNDARQGPFGVGWTHAYDIRVRESEQANQVTRVDFFGGAHSYTRDADGLYTPPPYLYDELSSEYTAAAINGPVLTDLDVSMDGTRKHFFLNGDERACDWIEDRHGNRTSLTYGLTVVIGGVTRKLLTDVADPSGRHLTFTWTNFGSQNSPVMRVTLVQGPAHAVSYDYYQDANLASVTLDPGGLNRTTTYEYTTAQGEAALLSAITDSLGARVTYGYELGPTGTVWAKSGTEPAGVEPGTTTPRNRSWSVVPGTQYPMQVGAGFTGGPGMVLNVDQYCRVTATNNQSLHTTFAYDSGNNLVACSSSCGPAGAPDGPCFIPQRSDAYTYGQHGNVLVHTVQGAQGQETTEYWNGSRYFAKKAVVDAEGRRTEFDVGPRSGPVGERGNILTVRNARYAVTGEEYEYVYDSFGRKTQETNLNNVVTTYGYADQWGNLTSVVQDPSGLARTTIMVYDAAGHVLQSTDPLGQTSVFAYNALGQPVSAAFPARGNTPAETVTYTYGANGRLTSVTDNRGATTMAYEPNGDRVASVQDPVTGTIGYTYGLGGERLTMTLPGGGVWTYFYTAYPILPKDDPNSLAWCLSAIVDDQGRRVDYGIDLRGITCRAIWNQVLDGGGNLLSYSRTDLTSDRFSGGYHSHGWLASIENRQWTKVNGQWTSSLLTRNDYTYSLTGMRLTNAVQVAGQTARTEAYGYDALSRLTSVDYGDAVTQTYAFDAMGNRTLKTENGAQEPSTYDAANRLLTRGGQPYTNDADGNTITGGGRTNTWDSQNRLVQCVAGGVTSSYVYGADGLRRQSNVNGTVTRYVLDNSMQVRETDGMGVSLATYLIGPRGPEYRRSDPAGTIRWYCMDGLGSVLAEVDPTGALTATRKYDVYGGVRASSGSSTSKQKYVGSLGHTSEDETGLIYMRARWMDPAIGRFMSEDPARDGGNWFEYCSSNPIDYRDSTGRAKDFAVFYVLLGEWEYAILNSNAFRVAALTFLEGSVASYGIFATPAERQAINMLWAAYESSVGTEIVPKSIMQETIAEFRGYDAMLLLAWWFMRDDLGLPDVLTSCDYLGGS